LGWQKMATSATPVPRVGGGVKSRRFQSDFPKTACAGNNGIYDFPVIMKLKRQTLVSQGSLSRMFQAATESWQRCDFQQSMDILERASRLDPGNSGILLDLGGLYGKRYDYTAAERSFEKAVRIAPRKTEALVAAGQQSRDFGNYAMAERYFQRALEQKDVAPKTLVRLAEIYERLRRLTEATDLTDRALRLDGTCASALLLRAKLDRQAGQLNEAEKLLRSFLLSKSEPPIRAQGWYELGGILDRQGRYDEAMAALLEAKALLYPNAGPHIVELKIVRARLEKMKTGLSAEMLKCWFDSGQMLPPPHRLALLGGHPRSGTTLLEQVLDSHPDIVSVEETTIFHDDAYMPLTRGRPDNEPMLSVLEAASTGALQQSRAGYFRSAEMSLGNPIGNRLLIDKNPSLTFLIPLLIRVFPEIKLLVALRDPRDVCLSCFMQSLPLNQGSSAYLSLESTVEEYIAMMTLRLALAPLIKNPCMEVRYEDMVNDLEPVARRTLDFLGVPWDAKVLGFDEHARQKVVRSPTYADVAKPVYKRAVGRWRNYQKYLEPHLSKLEPFVKAFGYE
jgi:tetratricopeptide (TPR) repeat protein